MKIFNELDHRLSVVRRWGILHTLQDQTVAEHVHNVVRITIKIGAGWFKLDHEELLTAIMWAHHHDDEEALSGDLPSMVKPYFDVEAFRADHADLLLVPMAVPEHIENIVKLADKMEGMYFLAMEIALGNQFAFSHFDEEFGIITEFSRKFDRKVQLTVGDWLAELRYPLKSTRHSRRGR